MLSTSHNRPQAAPAEIDQDQTDRLANSLITATAATGEVGTPDDAARRAIKDLGDYLMTKASGGRGPPPPKFLGVSSGGWTKMLFSLVIAGLLGAGAWVLSTSRGLDDVKRDHAHHEQHGHDETKKDIDLIEKHVGEIEGVQRVQAEKLKTIDQNIGDIKTDLRRRRRR